MIPGMGHISILLVMIFVAVYAVGLGPIPYMIGADIFESGPRPIGMSIGCFFNWFSNFIVGITFPILQSFLSQYVFMIFAISCAIITIIVIIMMDDGSHENDSNTSDNQIQIP